MAESVLELADRLRCVMSAIYSHILTACACFALGRENEAENSLTTAMELALPDRIYMPFAEHYPQLYPLPERFRPVSALEEVRTLAGRFETGKADVLRKLYRNFPFGLTERECEVAYLAAQGYSNPKIAEKLFISRNTVKFHLKKAYEKIGSSSRSDLEQIFKPFIKTTH
jgi:LuxR family maltose regulon positive regulatory protein